MPFAWTGPRRRWATLAGVVILLGGAFALDDAVARLAARPIQSGQLKTTLSSLRFLGDGSPLVLLTLLAFAVAPNKRGPAALALAAALLSGALVDRAKTVTARKRPIDTLPAPAAESWRAAANAGRNSSFPSGHAATAFGFARGMALVFPPAAGVAYSAAAGTAVSRMFEQRHYLSDCAVGGLVGWTVATLVWGAWSRISARRNQRSDDAAPPDVIRLARPA